MHGTLARANVLGRNVMKTFIRNGSHGGVPGENLPFDMTNRYKLTALFMVYVGSGLAAPFLITRHQLLKK
ncbi:cytochrome c oxidase subunit 7C, mitochondrial-like [Maniola hyperantus]|uniref:cytochrome c oxidase subunit 7C, mitochondrial-like n=1 Tax=Aphantopus hyperantus TaxID=2795564 RepID=UPI0015690544|nr:cytochrome c oxidase subunit 7C, mitochondrial-like [Maniola hyperantus]